MSNVEWAIIGAFCAHAIAVIAALVKLVAWAATAEARFETRLDAIETKVDNDIAGRRIVAELRTEVAAIKATLADLREQIRDHLGADQR